MPKNKEIRVRAACLCDTGRIRTSNQDNLFFNGTVLPERNDGLSEVITNAPATDEPAFFAVFDGMGGESHGETAAFIAAETLRRVVSAETHGDFASALANACLDANERICETATQLGGQRMGSTAAVLCFFKNTVFVCNIGDSRIYRLRGGKYEQLSVDHTDARHLPADSRRKPLLTQHLGIWPDEMLIEPYLAQEQTQSGDCYLICSDGLTDMLSDEEVTELLALPLDAAERTQRLVNAALERGGRDNVTVIVTDVQ